MLLLEFAAQGVRGVAPSGGRAALRPGYNVLSADGAALRRLLEALLFPEARDAEQVPRAAGGAGAGPLRAGLTLVGADRVTYRLVRDFAAGCQLHRFDAERRAFAPVSQDLAEIAAFLRDPVGVPTRARMTALLTFAAAELPSRSGGGGLAVAGAASAGAAARPAATVAQATRRVSELSAELVRAEAAEKLQYQMDGLQTRLFKLEEALRSGQRLQEGLATAEAALAALQPVAEVAAALGDPAGKLGAFARASARRDEALARVAAEREALEGAEARGAPLAPWSDGRFWAGAASGALALALGAAGAASGSELRTVALLALPAFGWAGWVAHRWIGGLDEWERQGRRRKVVDDWERKVGEQFGRDATDVAGALGALGVTKPAELAEQLERLAEAEVAVAGWRGKLVEWGRDPETAGALAAKGQVEEELKGVESRLAGEAGGFVRDARTVEAELERARAELAQAQARPATPPAPSSGAEDGAPAGGVDAVEGSGAPLLAHLGAPGGEPLRALLERAAAELGGSPAAVARTVAQRASQAISGLTLNRLTGVTADDRGNVQVVSGGRPAPALTLPPADRDLVYVALKLALLEQAVASGKTAAVLEDAFAGLSDAARRTIGRLLKQAAKAGQILHATSDPAFREAADHQA
ncbi:MAG: hypothetical protein IPO09_08665 [Anaeromyxobacter sp.]|nr:hypothetical protein [Anaeromyxobacter sp.]